MRLRERISQVLSTRSGTTARVIKALGLFGSVQGLGMVAALVRTKCAALFIGPAGLGIVVLLSQAIETVSNFTTGGLRQSAVRDISDDMAGHPEKLPSTLGVTRRLGRILGMLGLLLVFFLAPVLNRWTFGADGEYTWAFRVLSLVLLFNTIAGSDLAILQGLGRLKALARATVRASVVASLAVILLYWLMGMRGIVPGILCLPAATWLFAKAELRKEKPQMEAPRSIAATFDQGRTMLMMGVYLTVSSVLTILGSYIFSVWLSAHGGGSDAVGVFQAGFSIVNNYMGVVFTAIGMEFFPRLSGVGKRRMMTQAIVSHEIKMALWILLVLCIILMCLSEPILRLLYSNAFEGARGFVDHALPGVLLRAASWCLAFVLIARADGRIYVVTEALSIAAMLALYFPGWKLGAYGGLGWAYSAWYLFYFLLVYFVVRIRHKVRLGRGIGTLLFFSLGLTALAILLKHYLGPLWTGALILPWLLPMAYYRIKK